MESRQTQSSRDDGIDAIAVNEDPILGGPAIIQAKRYSKVVGYESVTALAGVIDHKRAAKGILVTTSWVGKASRDFAHANGRMQIIEGRELKRLLADLTMDVLISLPGRAHRLGTRRDPLPGARIQSESRPRADRERRVEVEVDGPACAGEAFCARSRTADRAALCRMRSTRLGYISSPHLTTRQRRATQPSSRRSCRGIGDGLRRIAYSW